MAATIFVAASVCALTISPSARTSTQVAMIWDPLMLLCLALWCASAAAGHIMLQRWLPRRDELMFPAVMTLCGWGMVIIWRLQGAYALRQAVWICIGTATMLAVVRWSHWLRALRRYPYISLMLGVLLTALTVIIGVNPSGAGPRLWLAIGGASWFPPGVFFQPSESLKLLLAIFLAAYLSRHHTLLQLKNNGRSSSLPLAFLAPLLVMWGLSMFLVIVQRDLGAGWVLYWGFLCIFFLATGRRRYAVSGLLLFGLGTAFAYGASNHVRLRLHGWLDPWSDADGKYYQFVQALEAMRAGGILGAGFGNGTPQSIPLAHSDFIFAALINEWGKLGAIALVILISILVQRIIRLSASQRSGSYAQYLAMGVAIFMAVQAGVNIAGVLRVLPMTGVALPFVSYGGSALVALFAGVGLAIGCSEIKVNRA
ncbi:MAG TPA: FtsW/RodA/SpoVE family cell cycle protein [Anaerolineales bacterium]|nr:FtsW/RodA/SpoVE family cell cycle protein [Anaerolineales bacterium]